MKIVDSQRQSTYLARRNVEKLCNAVADKFQNRVLTQVSHSKGTAHVSAVSLKDILKVCVDLPKLWIIS